MPEETDDTKNWACVYRLHNRLTDCVVVEAVNADDARRKFDQWAEQVMNLHAIAMLAIAELEPYGMH